MASNYRKLGEFIREIDRRNTENRQDNLLGLSVAKCFIPSIANTVGTDFRKYKVVEKGQFAYIPDTSRRGDKIAIALLEDWDSGLVSNVYTVFEVVEEGLLPKYLELWFRRPEFDRYARFKSHGSVRELFDWEQLCDVELPVPSLDEQRKIVGSFLAIEHRIASLQQLNDKLADSIAVLIMNAQTSQKQTIGLGELCTLCSSKRIFASEYQDAGVPFYRGSEITALSKGQPLSGLLYISRSRFEEIRSRFGAPKQNDILLTAVGTIGNSYLVQDEEFYFKDGNVIWLKDVMSTCVFYLYGYMQTKLFADDLIGITIGSTQSALTIDALGSLQIPVPSEEQLAEVNNACKSVLNLISLGHAEIRALTTARQAMLSELGR